MEPSLTSPVSGPVAGGPKNLLVLGDSPLVNTGFGRVLQELLSRWEAHFDRIDVWAINHMGKPAPIGSRWGPPKYRLFPAGRDWARPDLMQGFLELLQTEPADGRLSDYTHVFILQDTFLLRLNSFPEALQKVAELRKIKTLLYYPVDAPIEPDWTDILSAVDVPVAYTHWGLREAAEAVLVRRRQRQKDMDEHCGKTRIPEPRVPVAVLPHGVDAEVFFPLWGDLREAARREIFGEWLKPGDRLLVNVNQQQRRKDMVGSLSLIRELRRLDPRYRLFLHCQPDNKQEGVCLDEVARQLGLEYGVDWAHSGSLWQSNHPPQPLNWMNQLYNAADMTVSTTLGEGWGLSLTEAWAAGCPVAAPGHTSCTEIMASRLAEAPLEGGLLLPLDERPVVLVNDNNRVRYPVDVRASAQAIHRWFERGLTGRPGLSKGARQWLSWDRIAAEWLRLMGVAGQ